MTILVRGGGDLASGIALRLHHAGIKLLVTELEEPLVVRRLVSFAEAVHEGEWRVEDVTSVLISDPDERHRAWEKGTVPVLVDPDFSSLNAVQPLAVLDARMRKKPPQRGREQAPLVIGLGPGFQAGKNCHAVIETNRGHNLGRVYWKGEPEADTGIPGDIGGYSSQRVLRAPRDGRLETLQDIGSVVKSGKAIARIDGDLVRAPFPGAVRGLLRDGTRVRQGMKIGDLDPRGEPAYARVVSDKSRSLGGAVLEALLSQEHVRSNLWI